MNNKNLKVISSLAMAGILAATGISTVSAATPKSLGVYRKLVNGDVIAAPYVLSSKSDRVTTQNLKADHGNITVSEGTVKTGTIFRKDGEDHTVIIYGDVDGNGVVDVRDVTATVNGALNGITGVKKEAADVKHNGRVDVNDVSTLVDFVLNDKALDITLKAEEEEPVNYNYTLKVNGNNVVNNVNEAATEVVVTPKASFEQGKTYTVEVLDANGKALTTAITGTFTGDENKKSDGVTGLDVSGLENDKTYIVRLRIDKRVLGEVKIQKHADTTNINANVKIERTGTDDAMIAVESPATAQLVKVYCTKTEPTGGNDLAKIAHIVDTQKVTPYTLSNGTLAQTIFTNSDLGSASTTIYYVVEDIYGNRVLGDTLLEAHGSTADTTISSIVAEENANEFDITFSSALASGRKAIVTLYKDGKIVTTDEITGTGATTATTSFATAIQENGVGTYTVKAYVEATADSKPSLTADSATTEDDEGKITVSQLAQVTDVKVDVENSKITWKDEANKKVKGLSYTVTVLIPKGSAANGYTGEYIKSADKTANDDVAAVTISTIDNTKKEAVLPAIAADTSYKVQVVANTTTARKLSSEATVSSEFFKITQPTVTTEKLEKAVKFKGISEAKLKGNNNATISYAVEVYKIINNERVLQTTKTVKLTETAKSNPKTYETVVDGLEAGEKYQFVFVAKVNNVEAKSTLTAQVEIPLAARAISGLKVNEAATEAKAGEIRVNGTTAYINGEEFTDTTKFSTEYQGILNGIVANLKTDDIVTVSGNNIDLELKHGASATLTLGAAAENKTIKIVGNSYERTVATTADKKVANMTLSAPTAGKALFKITSALDVVDAGKVELNGVTLASTVGTYTVKASKENTINGIKVNASADTEITPTAEAAMTAKASSSNLKFVTNKGIALTIGGDNDLDIKQTGNITIESKGNVTLTSPKATVKGDINVTVENGTLDLTGANTDTLSGKKNIKVNNVKNDTVSETTIVKGYLANKAPFSVNEALAVTNILDIYDAKTKTLTGATPATDSNGVTTITLKNGTTVITLEKDKTIEDVITFLKNLGISQYDTTSTALVDATTGVMTLTINSDVSDYTVPYLNK